VIFEQYIGEALVSVLGVAVGWLAGRGKQRADTKKIEVEILEKSLQVIDREVVRPLGDRLSVVQEAYNVIEQKLNRLQNAINKMYSCHALPNCPIRAELQKPKNRTGKAGNAKPATVRQRKRNDRKDLENNNDTHEDGDADADARRPDKPACGGWLPG